RIGYGILPAEYIIKEHYRIGSTRAILSRSFCNANKVKNADEIKDIFEKEILKIRNTEKAVLNLSETEFEKNRLEVIRLTNEIVKTM
ncbi:MAG: aldolase, partial [Acutalibacteraceae bacterium]|nr:aldolase [Acutalibacteraceae bacterium]